MSHRIVFLFPAAGRNARIDGVADGTTPKEFFYGYLSLAAKGYDVRMADSRADPQGSLNRAFLFYERVRNRFLNLGFTRQRVVALTPELRTCDSAISFTDAFSLSLGLYARARAPRTKLIGGFHGLTDILAESNSPFDGLTERIIRKAAHGLDHLFFFGEADRQEAIRRYGLPAEKTSLFRFGVDTDFWCPDESLPEEDMVFSAGSDPKRDFATLVAAPLDMPVHILTRLPLSIPAGKSNIHLVRGSFHAAAITDQDLRDHYRKAAVVAVPLRDVNQPTGYSVTLQAMACGKPVVLSKIRGLWDPEVFVSGENCLLVPPGDARALGEAIAALRADPDLRARIGRAARATALAHFPMARMDRDVEILANTFAPNA